MVDQSVRDDAVLAAPPALALRRVLFFTLVGLTIAALIALLVVALSPGGFGLVDLVLVVLFAVTLAWTVIGFWNAAIGVIIMRFARDPAAAVTPAAARVRGNEPITASTAILACVRNEPPERVIHFLAPLIESLVARGSAEHIHLYVLSDTNDPAMATIEEMRFAALTETWRGRFAVSYRRRRQNTGFKAGNIRDFCGQFGARHELAVVLDADSLMTADAVLRLIRIMQADPRIGILQSLVTGLPSTSTFARLFQFGMRLAMRSYTIGSAWWQGDCGPYWGHNAIVRLAPFMAHCELPVLDDALISGHVLSHDQVEAVLMRRAGYEVRVLADEGDSFEQNPPTLPEFVRRDLRWCQGNMQYWHFLKLPGLKFVSRYQLVFALLMFLGSPAWIGLLVIGTIVTIHAGAPAAVIRSDAGLALFLSVLVMWFAPNYATALDVLTRRKLRYAFGGGLRFGMSVLVQTIFVILLLPIMWFSHTMFLARLLTGRTVGWTVQVRSDHVVPVSDAINQFWPLTLLGLAVVTALAFTVPAALPYALFIAGGPLLSIPLAVLTARPALGRALVRIGLGRLPEETSPPPELRAAGIAAIDLLHPRDGRPLPGSALRDSWRSMRGVARSLRIYYGHGARRDAMDKLYGEFVRPGDLVFDVGAHVGDRVAALRRLGARVVAVEPQPALARTLRLLYGRDRSVTIEPLAVGAAEEAIALKLNLDNPTVSSASDAFIRAAHGAKGWQGQAWERSIEVPMTTLDALIARHGRPAFIKLDVEGFEAQALAGLTHPVPALSFEFTTIQRDVAAACLRRCTALGYARFNAALGESQAMVHPAWVSCEEMADWLAALPQEANSGDIYACRE